MHILVMGLKHKIFEFCCWFEVGFINSIVVVVVFFFFLNIFSRFLIALYSKARSGFYF